MVNKKLLGLVGLAGGLVYASQNYTIRGWQNLRIEPIQSSVAHVEYDSPSRSNRSYWERPELSRNNEAAYPAASQGAQAGRTLDGAPTILNLDYAPRPVIEGIEASGPGRSVSQTQLLPAAPIRIASFNLHLYGTQKAESPFVAEVLTKILRQYDLVAIQEIATKKRDLLPLLVQQLNRSDRRFDYVLGPLVGRPENPEQFAFLFDTETLETDRTQLYSVDDPENLITREPLVGWFRCKGHPPEVAFTFTAVNLHLDEDRLDDEVRVLPELVRSIQRDGRSEDDILLLGDFGASDQQLQTLRNHGMIFGIEGIPTTTRGSAMVDNIVFPAKATDEFTGQSGVFDFLRRFNFSIDEATQISDHLPVWAEFTSHEGGQPGRIQ